MSAVGDVHGLAFERADAPARADAPERCDDDFHFEPVPGLPEALPPGERILWAGAPQWSAVALEIFHVRAVAFYAGLIVLWRVLATLYDGAGAMAALLNGALLTGVFALALGLLALLAYATAKTTRYTITDKRIVMRIGIALTMSVNLPFRQVESVDYRPAPRGTGAVALTMEASGGLGYAVLWPHVRPFKMSQPQPMLRCIPHGERVAQLLGKAIIASRGEAAALHVVARSEAVQREPQPVARKAPVAA